MKGELVKKIRNEFNLRTINGEKVELYDFYSLCGIYKKLKSGELVK